jgi:hypothetical protein
VQSKLQEQTMIPSIELTERASPPAWALWERFLLDAMSRAAVDFVQRYTRPDGTLIWREEWPGMDGSDDAYESFFNFPLLYALGGDPELDRLARSEWEAITRQFTAYGQVYREFDAYYDWMHHGESSLLFYYFGLSDPKNARMIGRARRFAAMYMGEDPEADNYDPALRLIRSPITGSRGPRYINTAEDWSTHREVLALYPPPYDDIPGISPGAKTADWNDDAIFMEILRLLNQRMMRGDIPLNLTTTSLITHAYLYSGEEKYRDWVKNYVSAWMERVEMNGGLLPDNVGPKGVIGECMDGKWYGGYYGWRWPHGFMNLIEPCVIAASNALLLTGDNSFLDLPRQLLDRIYAEGKEEEGIWHIPNRHREGGWYDYRPASVAAPYAIYLWYLSQRGEDEERVRQWTDGCDLSHIPDTRGKGDNTHTQNWYLYRNGNLPGYPEAILRVNYAEMARRCARMRDDNGNPETWDVHHWQDLNPVVLEGLVNLTLGAPQTIYHGGLLHCLMRYFDPERRRPGLPPDVAALVGQVEGDTATVEFVNLNPLEERRVILQAGAFAEHQIIGAESSGKETTVGGAHLTITLAPASGGSLRIRFHRYKNKPAYAFPSM